jgi:hypothetical protein
LLITSHSAAAGATCSQHQPSRIFTSSVRFQVPTTINKKSTTIAEVQNSSRSPADNKFSISKGMNTLGLTDKSRDQTHSVEMHSDASLHLLQYGFPTSCRRESMRAASMSLKPLHNPFVNSISLTGYTESNSHFPSSRILHDNCTNLPSFATKFSHGFTANRTAPLNEKRLLFKTGSKTQVFHKINGNDTQFVQDIQIN